MKGSPAKMGMIQGTAGHRSALKAMEEKAAMKAMEKAAAMKAMEEKSAMKAMKKDSPADFNAKLKQASADGKLSGKFKEAVDASPAKFGFDKKEKAPKGYKKAGKYLSEVKDKYEASEVAKKAGRKDKLVKATAVKAMKKDSDKVW